MSDSLTPWTVAHQASLSITNSQSLLKLMSIELVMPSNCLILCCPLPLLPSMFPSIKVLSIESILLISWPKYWSFSFSISPSKKIQDWFPLGLDGSPCSPRDSRESSPTPQFKSIYCSVLSFLYSSTLTYIHDYRTTIPLTRWTSVSKVMSLLFNMLSRLVITFSSKEQAS